MPINNRSSQIHNQISHITQNCTTEGGQNPTSNAVVEDYFDSDYCFSHYLTSPDIGSANLAYKPLDQLDLDFEFLTDYEPSIADKSVSGLNSSSKKIKKIFTILRDSSSKLKGVIEPVNPSIVGSIRRYWSPEEDEQLQTLYTQLRGKWTYIGRIIGNRTGKQVRDRYNNFLRHNVINTRFTAEEDALLLNLICMIGLKWTQIASHMLGRTEYQVKNRYYNHLKKFLPHQSSNQQIPDA